MDTQAESQHINTQGESGLRRGLRGSKPSGPLTCPPSFQTRRKQISCSGRQVYGTGYGSSPGKLVQVSKSLSR